MADPMSERRALLNLAYRLLGSLSEAEDAVQEAYARWYALTDGQRDGIERPGAWLSTVASRICLDILGSARARRERYVGAWLPEPLPAFTPDDDPVDRVTLDESVSMAFLVMLDTMTPAERVAFVLHDVFRYSFTEIADVVGRTPAACRQLATAARRRLDRPRAAVAERTAVVRDFQRAWLAKDIPALVGLLDPDAVAVSDGGGLVNAAPGPIFGPERIAQYAVAILNLAGALSVEERLVNGEPGLVAERDGVADTVIAFDVVDGRITRLWGVRNPEKLTLWKVP